MSRRFSAAGIHLLISAVVGALAALVVFLVWYPPPYNAIAGGLSLFTLLVSVDIVLGPALTAVAASPSKPMKELRRDLMVIVAVQLAAFAYGMHTIAAARPVFVSFEIDRLRVVSAADIEPDLLKDAPPNLRTLPWFGPERIAAVKPADPAERIRSVELGLAGFDLSMIPRNWREYRTEAHAAWSAARPLTQLIQRYPQVGSKAVAMAAAAGQPMSALRFLPLMSRSAVWTAVLKGPDADIVGYLPVDGFL